MASRREPGGLHPCSERTLTPCLPGSLAELVPASSIGVKLGRPGGRGGGFLSSRLGEVGVRVHRVGGGGLGAPPSLALRVGVGG